MVTHDPNYEEKTPVTLEGIAAVLAVVPALLGQAPQKEQQAALSDALGMLSRACVMAGGKKAPPPQVVEPADATWKEAREALDAIGITVIMDTGRVLSTPERIRELGQKYKSVMDLLEPFRCAGESDHAGALSRLIAENKALKEDEAWVEQSVRLISQSEKNVHLTVKAGSNLPEAVGVLLEERKHLSTLLEESGFPSGFRGAYTLFARMQELVVAWREKHQSEVAQRMEDAAETMGDTIRDRLLAILFPGQPAPSLDLEGCLRDVDSRLNRNRPPLGNPPPYIVRDAALEEAAGGIDLTGLADWAKGLVRERIRALKSKPAPQPSENLGELQQAAPTWEPDSPTDLPDEEQSPRTLTQEQERELAERRATRADVGRQIDVLATSDVHDFGWALAQMRAGKKVRRKAWGSSSGPVSYGGLCNAVPVDPKELVATDWELAE